MSLPSRVAISLLSLALAACGSQPMTGVSRSFATKAPIILSPIVTPSAVTVGDYDPTAFNATNQTPTTRNDNAGLTGELVGTDTQTPTTTSLQAALFDPVQAFSGVQTPAAENTSSLIAGRRVSTTSATPTVPAFPILFSQ